MKFFVLAVLISVLISGYTASSSSSIAGIWTDSRWGGNFSICVNNQTANGLYSQFGIAEGTLNSQNTTWTGSWYQGGLSDCLTGTFSLTFHNNTYSGNYSCDSLGNVNFTWSGNLLVSGSKANLTSQQCGTLIDSTSSASMDGQWSYQTYYGPNQVDFCVNDDGTFDASYVHPGSYIPLGFDSGTWTRSQTVGVGSFYRSNKNGALPGTSLWFVNSDGDLANIWWAGHYEYLNINETYDTLIHSYDTYTIVSGTSYDQCIRFRTIENEPYDYYPYAQLLFYFNYVSASSTLVAPLLLSLLLIVLL